MKYQVRTEKFWWGERLKIVGPSGRILTEGGLEDAATEAEVRAAEATVQAAQDDGPSQQTSEKNSRYFSSLVQAQRFVQARRRVIALREFYQSLGPFAFLLAVWLYFGLSGYWTLWLIVPWGVVVAFLGLRVLVPDVSLGDAWVERKVQAIMEQQIRDLSVEKGKVTSQLRLLQAQIEPHFLFNTLASVVSLTEVEPARARAMLESFIAYLRQSLNISRQEDGTLADEVKLLRAYLEIIAIRMGRRLEWSIDVDPELLSMRFAPMLLQPLVENAIKHGLEPKVEGGHLRVIVGRTEPGRICAEVLDDGSGFDPTRSRNSSSFKDRDGGMGLANLRQRLELLYEGDARLTIEDAMPGTRVKIDMPETMST